MFLKNAFQFLSMMFFTIPICLCSYGSPNDNLVSQFNSANEQPYLQNIQQITFADYGFEKCGEAYLSPDASTIIFQAVPKGKEHYQIYTLSLSEKIPRVVSTGYGACTCAYFRPDGQKIIFASSHEDPDQEWHVRNMA